MVARYAILLDGAFVIKKLQARLQKFPAATDVELKAHADLII